MNSTETLLKQGIAAAKAGHKAKAWRLLARFLRRNQRNELAWYWLSRVVDSREQRIKCLENVLRINPGNVSARKRLAQLQGRAEAPLSTPQPASSPPANRCSNCGATNRAGATFCKGCGHRLRKITPSPRPQTVRCPSCGAENRAAYQFCRKCGQELGVDDSAPTPLADLSQSARPRSSRPRPPRSRPQRAPVQADPASANASGDTRPASPVSPQSVPVPSQRAVDVSKARDDSSQLSPGPAPVALSVAGVLLLMTAGAWVISSIMSIGYGDLNALIGVWNLLVCVVILLVAIQLFKGNAESRSTAIKLFSTNVMLMGGQIGLFGEMMDESMLTFDLIGLATLGLQAAVLWLGKKQIESWWQAKQRFERAK